MSLTKKLQRLQKVSLSNEAIDRFVQHVSTGTAFLPLPGAKNESSVATAQVQALCVPYVEKTVRSTMTFQRDGIERANAILQQRLGGMRTILSL